jgi:nitrate/nitrite transporter NarK
LAAGGINIMNFLFSVYLMMWIQTFINSESATVDSVDFFDEGDAKNAYAAIMINTCILCAPIVPAAGVISDKVAPFLSVPTSFLLRGGITLYFYLYVDSPTGTQTIFVCAGMMILTMVENIAVNAMFLRTMPSDVRGSMLGVFAMAGHVAALVFTLVSKNFITNSDNYKAPFKIVIFSDFVLCLFGIILALCGKLRFPT